MRYLAFFASIVLTVLTGMFAWYVSTWWMIAVLVFGAMMTLGVTDLLNKESTLKRNYPLLIHLRYFLESIGPEMRQYFVQADMDKVPFSRQERTIVYTRSKNESDVVAFGTLRNVYNGQYEWINHSMMPTRIADYDFRIDIGSMPGTTQPYRASVFNISAMSFGALSAAAIRALSGGAQLGGFYLDTGEGSASPYHFEGGGDLVWEIGTGYFGCRTEDGHFDPERFRKTAVNPQIKMIEVKLSQGAKPGKGGVLPAAKVSPEIAATRGVPMGIDCVSPAGHSAFSTPKTLLEFVASLREMSGGKPTGFKLCIGHPWEWFAVAKAMLETGLLPDFIVVDGGEGGTGAAPAEFMDHVGVPMHEGVMLVHNTLVGLGLRDRIKIGAAGKITTGFDLVRTMALGADWCNAARGYMFSLGCIQSLSCHTDRCPTGIATQDPDRWKHLDVADKKQRAFQFHRNTLHALGELLSSAGLTHPQQIGPEHVIRRISETQVQSLSVLYNFIPPDSLLDGSHDHELFRKYWDMADASTFVAPEGILKLRESKVT